MDLHLSDVVGFAGDLGTAAAAEEVVRRHRDIEILVNNLGSTKLDRQRFRGSEER
jgi:hypothetical protein